MNLGVVSSRCHTYIPIYEVLCHDSEPFRSVVWSPVAHPEVVGSTPDSVAFPSAGFDTSLDPRS